MDKKKLAKLLEAAMEDDGKKAELVKLETEEDAIKHAEWAAKLKPGDKVNLLGYGTCVVSPEGVQKSRITLFCTDKQDDGTFHVACMLSPVTAITPVD